MQDIAELLFRVLTQDDGGLNKVELAVKSIGASSGYTGKDLQQLESVVRSAFAQMTASGLSFDQSLASIAKNGKAIGDAVGTSAKEVQAAARLAQQQISTLGAQTTQLAAQQRQLQQALGGVQNAFVNPLQAVAASATNALASMGPLGLALGAVGLAASLGGKAMFDLVDSQGRAAQQTVNMAAQIGITAGEMKKLQAEAAIIGVSFQTMQIAARQLSVGLEEPVGAGKRVAQTLQALGVATQTASGQLRGEGQVFNEVIEKLAGVESQSKRTDEATRLFGSRSSAAIQLLVGKYKELDAAARELGYGDTTKLQESLAEGEQSINKLSLAWDLFKSKLAEKIAPVVISVVQRFTRLGQSFTDSSAWDSSKDDTLRNSQAMYASGQFSTSPLLNSLGLTSDQLAAARKPAGSLTAGGLATSAQVAAQDSSAARAVTERFNSGFAKTADGLTARLQDITTQLKEARETLSRGGLGLVAARDTTARANDLAAQRQQLEDQIARLRQAQSETRRLRENARYPDLESPIEFRKLTAERQKAIDTTGDVKDVDAVYLPRIQEAIRKFFQKVGTDAQRSAEQYLKSEDRGSRRESLEDVQYGQDLKARLGASEAQYKASQQQLGILDNADRQAAERRQSRELSLLNLQNGGETAGTIAQATQYREGSAAAVQQDALREIDSRIADASKTIADAESLRLSTSIKIADLENRRSANAERIAQTQSEPDSPDRAARLNALASDQSSAAAEIGGLNSQVRDAQSDAVDAARMLADLETQRLRANAEYWKEIDQARLDAEQRIAELQKRQRDEYRQQAGELFDALRTRGGLQQFGRNFGLQQGRQIFTNVATPVLQNIGQTLGGLIPGQIGADGQRTGIGNILQGTAFDSSRSRTPQVVALDSNTSAVNANTVALLRGGTASGIPGVLAGGATATALSASGSIATPPFLSPQQAQAVSSSSGGGQDALQKAVQIGTTSGLTSVFGAGASPTGTAALSQLFSGLTGSLSGKGPGLFGTDLFAGLNGNAGMTGQYRAGNIIGSTAAVGGGIATSVSQFRQGGASGIAGGVAAAAGTAALVDPDPLSKSILSIFSLGAGLFKSLLPDPREIRQAQIANQTAYSTYVAPPTLNRSLSASGGYENFTDKYGQPQASAYTSVAIAQPYKYQSPLRDPNGLMQDWQTQPGQVIEPYQAAAAQPNYQTQYAPATYQTNLTITAFDSKSIMDNGPEIASSLQKQITEGHPVGAALQKAILG